MSIGTKRSSYQTITVWKTFNKLSKTEAQLPVILPPLPLALCLSSIYSIALLHGKVTKFANTRLCVTSACCLYICNVHTGRQRLIRLMITPPLLVYISILYISMYELLSIYLYIYHYNSALTWLLTIMSRQ